MESGEFAPLKIKSMNCSKFEKSLSEYLDGMLAQREAGPFRAHALKCRSCRTIFDDVKDAVKECKQSLEMELPSTLEAALLNIPI